MAWTARKSRISKITGIAWNLVQNDGRTAINNGDFITFAQGNAGLSSLHGESHVR